MGELISIIVPVYKVEKYLNRCINSIINQTYKNIEIILIDDGSPDRCGEICEEYSNKDNRITVVHKKNGGLSDARNIGMEIAKGNYITFIDSDDWVHEEYIERLYKLLKENNSDISICNFIRTSKEYIQDDTSKVILYEFSNTEALEQLTGKYYIQMVVAWGKLYKRELFNGIKFPYGKLHEDEFTTYKVLFKSDKIVFTTETLYYYWQREDSITGVGFNIKGRMDVIEAYRERIEFFTKYGLNEMSNNTYKSLFFIYLSVYSKLDEVNSFIDKNKFYKEFIEFRYELRKRKYNLKFKIFYELFYFMPKIMNKVYLIYKNKKWM